MDAAELKTLRESMNLPISFIADQLEVSTRAVEDWENENRPVPKEVKDLILKLNSIFQNTIEKACAELDGVLKDEGKDGQICFLRYRTDEDLWKYRKDLIGFPASFHAAIIARIRFHVLRNGVSAIIKYFDPKAYEEWRKETKSPDNESMRMKWATEEDLD